MAGLERTGGSGSGQVQQQLNDVRPSSGSHTAPVTPSQRQGAAAAVAKERANLLSNDAAVRAQAMERVIGAAGGNARAAYGALERGMDAAQIRRDVQQLREERQERINQMMQHMGNGAARLHGGSTVLDRVGQELRRAHPTE